MRLWGKGRCRCESIMCWGRSKNEYTWVCDPSKRPVEGDCRETSASLQRLFFWSLPENPKQRVQKKVSTETTTPWRKGDAWKAVPDSPQISQRHEISITTAILLCASRE